MEVRIEVQHLADGPRTDKYFRLCRELREELRELRAVGAASVNIPSDECGGASIIPAIFKQIREGHRALAEFVHEQRLRQSFREVDRPER